MRRVAALLGALALLGACNGATPASPDQTATPAPPDQTATPEAAESPPPAPPTEPTPVPPHACTPPACFDAGAAMEHIRVLSVDIGPREAGSDADLQAAEWTRERLAELGLNAYLQPFTTPAGEQTRNVIAVPSGIPVPDHGTPDPGEPYLIVGGHIDTVPGAPGANDNASGIAAVLEIARALSVDPAPLPVVFVAFGAEEQQTQSPRGTHHLGSRHYVATMSEQARAHLVAMLNLDMVGHGDYLYVGRMDAGSREATERLLRIAGEIDVPARERVTPAWSDNASFLREGMNAGWLWSGHDGRWHTPQDTFDHVQPESVNRAGALMLAAVRSYD